MIGPALYSSKTVEWATVFAIRVTDDDVFQAVFGDGVQVTATRDGFEVEDYDHD